MARRLINQNRRAEWAEQNRLQSRLIAGSTVRHAREIAATMQAMAQDFERSGNLHVQDEHQRRIARLLRADYGTSITTFADRILDGAKSIHGRMWRKDRADVYDRIEMEFLQQRGGEQIAEDISRTTRDQVMAMASRGRRDGMGQDEIARMIGNRVGVVSRARAGMIARTEIHSASVFASHEAAVDTGLPLEKDWLAASDARDDHAAADDGRSIPMDELFEVGGERLRYPGDPSGSAENVINCRCQEGHVVLD